MLLLVAAFDEGEQQAVKPFRGAFELLGGPLNTDQPFPTRFLDRFNYLVISVDGRKQSVCYLPMFWGVL